MEERGKEKKETIKKEESERRKEKERKREKERREEGNVTMWKMEQGITDKEEEESESEWERGKREKAVGGLVCAFVCKCVVPCVFV